MDITRLTGIAIAIALIYACAGRAAPGSGEDRGSTEPFQDRPAAAAAGEAHTGDVDP